jgi:hypothetical protein
VVSWPCRPTGQQWRRPCRGRGLNGYAALAALASEDGYTVAQTRSQGGMEQPGVLVLTPLAGTDGKDIDRIVSKRRRIGPTVVIASKWDAKLLERKEQRPRGWTRIEGVSLPQWRGFADDVTVTLSGLKPGLAKGWTPLMAAMARCPTTRGWNRARATGWCRWSAPPTGAFWPPIAATMAIIPRSIAWPMWKRPALTVPMGTSRKARMRAKTQAARTWACIR